MLSRLALRIAVCEALAPTGATVFPTIAGPRVYGGVRVDDHWMGDGRAEATAADIARALTLYRVAFGGTALLLVLLALVLNGRG